ncbi:hypothetical protein VE03_10639 [Pseudogymnoascus sp. 23342-1-I1]|nr:hypothetical protein VE03_10639 [Pseudogymnoascus sp. 23342-1-I1]
MAREVADEDEGDVEEGEGVCVADAEEMDFGGLDEEAESGAEKAAINRAKHSATVFACLLFNGYSCVYFEKSEQQTFAVEFLFSQFDLKLLGV